MATEANLLYSACQLTDIQSQVDELRNMLIELYEVSSDAVHDDVLRFSYHLDRQYASVKDYMLFLLIIGGTLPEETAYFDFPGEDSVAQFIQQKHAELFVSGAA